MDLNVSTEYELHHYLFSQGLISSETTWDLQLGGQTNKVWRLKGKTDLICKLYVNTISNPLFKNIPNDEYKCL